MPARHDGKRWWIALFGAYGIALVTMVVVSLVGPDEITRSRGSRSDGSGQVRAVATQEMVDQHQHMTELMRTDTSPQMVIRMNADPMWAAMRNDAFTSTLEDEQADIDRMLGRGAP